MRLRDDIDELVDGWGGGGMLMVFLFCFCVLLWFVNGFE